MPKYRDKVGFAVQKQTSPGIWENVVTEKTLRGDLLSDVKRNNASSSDLNASITLTNRVSILASKYAFDNMQNIVYATVDGVRWRVTSVENQRPRIILNFGGVYNGKKPS